MFNMRFILPLSLVFSAAQAAESGPPYLLTNYSAGAQEFTTCSRSPNGDKAVLWRIGDYSRLPLVMRKDASGATIGPAEHMALANDTIAISTNKVGGFVTLSTRKNGEYMELYATVYDRSGAMVTAPFKINDTQTQNLTGLVDVANDGTIAVAWQTWGNYQVREAYLKRFAPNGVALTYERYFGGDTLNLTGLETDPAGNIVVYFNFTDSTGRTDAYASRYSTVRDAFSPSTRVNTYLGRMQPSSGMAMNTQGAYVLTYSVTGQDGPGSSLYVQLFTSDGNRSGAPVRISTALSTNVVNARAVMFDNNSYAVMWMEDQNSVSTVKLREVSGSGVPGTEKVLASSLRNGNPFSLCGDASGNYSAIWRDYQTTATGWRSDIYAQDFVADTVPAVQRLENYEQVTGLSGGTNTWKYFKVEVPANTGYLQVSLSSSANPAIGNADIYLRYGAMPSAAGWDVRKTDAGNSDVLAVGNPPPGTFYIGVYGQAAYADTALTVSFR